MSSIFRAVFQKNLKTFYISFVRISISFPLREVTGLSAGFRGRWTDEKLLRQFCYPMSRLP